MTPSLKLSPLLLALAAPLALAADDDDALDLEAKPAAEAPKVGLAPSRQPDSTLRLTLEGAALQGERFNGQGSQRGQRLSVDLRWSGRLEGLGEGWRFGLSNRLDVTHPALGDQRNTQNHLREAYLAWQAPDGQRNFELGRLNQRHGPAYGYNPTDFFRAGATRSVVTADPVALRENRTGTFVLRASQLWTGGGASVAWAPALTRSKAGDSLFNLDLDATNARHRVLVTTHVQASQRWSGEALALVEEGLGTRVGLNLNGLVTDSAVLHAEWTVGRTPRLLDTAVMGDAAPRQLHQQAALGLTYAFAGGLSMTAEAEYNGAGLRRNDWSTLYSHGAGKVAAFFGANQADQELASRQAWLLYATQKGAYFKQLDITAFVRLNALDHSHLTWAELRYHWPRFDAALQWQRSHGGQGTEYGALPYRQALQLIGYWYF